MRGRNEFEFELIPRAIPRPWVRRLSGPLFGKIHPFSPSRIPDPYPMFRELRENDPVHRSPLMRIGFLTRYADCLRVLREPEFSVDRMIGQETTTHRIGNTGVLRPGQGIDRGVTRDTEIGGKRIRQHPVGSASRPPPTATRSRSPIPNASMSLAATTATSPADTGATSVRAPRSLERGRRSPSTPCCAASPISRALSIRRAGGPP